MFRRITLLILPVLAVFAGLAVVSSPASAEPQLSARSVTAAKPKPRTIVVRDCGDMNGPGKCATWDDDAWYLWDGKRYLRARKCKTARTPLPCIEKGWLSANDGVQRYRVRVKR